MASAFKVGDLVWAKMKGFPPWPGLVSEPSDNKKMNEKKPKFYIFFFGSENYAWVAFDNMWPYLEKREEYVAMLRPTHSFQEAVDAIDDYVREHGGIIPETPKKVSSPAKQSDSEEEKLLSGRRSRKRTSLAIASETPTKIKLDNKAKVAKEADKKKERRDSTEEKSKQIKKQDMEVIKSKKLSVDEEDEEDDSVDLKRKRISRKRNDEEEEEEESLDGAHGDEEEDVEQSPKDTKEKSKEVAEEGGDGDDDDGGEDESVEKLLVDEETAKKLNESKHKKKEQEKDEKDEGDGEKEKGEKNEEKEKRQEMEKEEEKKKVKRKESDKQTPRKEQEAKKVKSASKSESKEAEKTPKQSKTSTGKAKVDEGTSGKKKENGVVSGKKKSTATDKKTDSKKAFLPDVLSTTTTPKNTTTTTTKNTTTKNTTTKTTSLNKKLSSIVPTTKKIGFIGCGSMGSRLVQNLLASQHHVLLWNRTANKCKELSAKGAVKCSSPSDITKKSDIIVTCLSDAVAFKDVVYSSNGVLQAMKEGKGLVNLTTVDVETTLDACEAVSSRGGAFLEAAMLGSLESAAKGDLLVLVSGDQSLYNDCSSLFKAISKNIFNLVDIGTATKMQVVFSSLYGTTISGLAEGLSLASKVGIDPAEVLEVVSHTSVNSPLIRLKGEAMAKNTLGDVGIKLETLQKNIRLAINMSEEVDQPLHVGSVVNELFKKAKAKGYGDSDVAAVYRATDL